MRLIDQIHQGFVYGRRTRVLSDMILAVLPEEGLVLDVGCGDGKISKRIRR